jgi:predicted ATPase
VERAVRVEALEPLALEGRAEGVPAWRLLELHPDELALLRPPTTSFVGREPELDALERDLARTASTRSCRLCTVVGAPGIGKSRLVRELVRGRGAAATAAVGRCLSYGEGITYRPLAEIVRALAGGTPERVGELLRGHEQADLVAERVLGAIGLGEAGGREETFWAVRRLFEAAARERPLIAVFEDVHWAQPTLLELLEYLVGFSSGAPILLVCLARPDLLETRPAWATPHPSRSLLALEPLPDEDARRLVASLAARLDELEQARIVETAEGNPLFLEQLVAVQAAGGAETLPLTVQAVLAARIDGLEPGERAVLEHASVEGRSFHRGALAELLPESRRPDVERRLVALVHKQLVRPDPPDFVGEDAFRFTHVLTREAVYSALPKRLRAELHERVADWLEARPAADEIVGYHLEQAFSYRDELGSRDERLAARAAARLEAAGREALGRSDLPAAANLLGRAAALLPEETAARIRREAEAEMSRVLEEAQAAPWSDLEDERVASATNEPPA